MRTASRCLLLFALVIVSTALLRTVEGAHDGKVVSCPEEVRIELMACSAELRESCAEGATLAGVTETEIFSANLDAFTEVEYNVACGGTCAAAWESYFMCAKELLMGLPADLYHHFDRVHLDEEHYLDRISVMCNCPYPCTGECLDREMAKQVASSAGNSLNSYPAVFVFRIIGSLAVSLALLACVGIAP